MTNQEYKSWQLLNYFCKKFYQPDSWVVEKSSYKICQLKFRKFQVAMFSEKNTFTDAVFNIFRKSSLINHKCWICILIFTFMSTSETSYSKWTEFLYFCHLEFLIFCRAEEWNTSTRKQGPLFSAKKYWVIRFSKCFFWNIGIL